MSITNDIWTAEQFRDYGKTKVMPQPKSRLKYNNVKKEVDGKKFDSTKESKRYLELKSMVERGEISELHEQVKFTFAHNGVKICSYIADFTYNKDGKEVVEDVKSEMTKKLPVYKMKKKMMVAFFGIEINEV
jgi:hypothetical protein